MSFKLDLTKIEKEPTEHPVWDFKTEGKVFKSCAVLALGIDGLTTVLSHFGPAIDWHAENYSANAEELGLEMNDEKFDPGVYVWVGTMGSVRYETIDGTEWDHEVTGEFRAPTSEEWTAIQARECPWTKENCPRW